MKTLKRVGTGSSGNLVSSSSVQIHPRSDAEVILLANDLLKATGIDYDLQVGHLAPMKNTSALIPPCRISAMGFLDKRDFEGLKLFQTKGNK